MPELLPFAGLRYRDRTDGSLSDVVCPPYDVITAAQREALIARSPHNVVRVELPDGDYTGAASTLASWESAGILERDAVPALYGYRMHYKGPGGEARRTTGVIGALVLEPPGNGILPHEQTTPKAKTDRLELLRAARANTSPIWCLCAEPGLTAATGEPQGEIWSAVDEDGNLHELWAITDPAQQHRVGELAAQRPLLVADGHHRYETALAYMQEAGSTAGDEPGSGAGAVMALVVELAPEELEVLAIHRAVTGLAPGTSVRAAFEDGYELRPSTSTGPAILKEMSEAGAVGLVTREGVFLAVPHQGSTEASYRLDSQRVDATLAALPAHELTYEHDVPATLAAVGSGALDAAVLCRPATIDQIAATAAGGDRMPPKTTFFWPKPRTGLVLRRW
ncbi:MAG TPA: DUF1015 domain-containing protein [Acidimicrobiales bacterium]|nr:DUF1015 domain-containing protein [Acidimicrobiales bacterium]